MKNKKEIILVVVVVFTLMVFIAGATYAYFSETTGAGGNTEVEVKTATTDLLTFSVGEQISITADQISFAKGLDSRSGETFAQASLTANNSTNEASANYYVYLSITNNTFKYTQKTDDGSNNTEYPELLLTIIDPSGTELTTLDGYTHKVVTDNLGISISGFDVTEASGLITLINNKQIVAGTSSSAGVKTTNEKWQVKLTFVNYDEDQTDNAGASLNAKLMIQKEKKPTLAEHIISLYGGTQGNNNIYYHDGSLTNGISDGSYRYAGSDYSLTSKAINNGLTSLYSTSDTDTNFVIYCNEGGLYFTLQYDTNNTRYVSFIDAAEQAVLDGYLERAIKNYVCISDEETCSDANLFRIIGVFDEGVKLIKATSIGNMAWDRTDSNTWASASLNTYLNGDYLTSLGDFATNYIATTTWIVGGGGSYYSLPSEVYEYEITSSTATSLTVSKKIGLMYVSDYGFAANPAKWTTGLKSYWSDGDNYSYMYPQDWLCLGSNEWTITPRLDYSYMAMFLYFNQNEERSSSSHSCVFYNNAVRPAFYLNPLVTYSDGEGTLESPIRLG